ncbi:MAG: serine hydroxymethyltransferase, partial [Methylophaga nitratireducenticrescens]
FSEQDCTDLAGWMCDVIDSHGDEKVIAAIRDKVTEICKRLPVYS